MNRLDGTERLTVQQSSAAVGVHSGITARADAEQCKQCNVADQKEGNEECEDGLRSNGGT